MNRIEGKEFVFTGRISITRHDAWNLVIKCGGMVGTSITFGTDYAVIGEAAGVKSQKAQERGITVLDEITFFQWINEALEEIPVVVTSPVPEPVLEEPDTPIDIKEWIKGATCFICENCGNAFAIKPPTLFPQCPLCINKMDMSMFSFNNPDVLERIKKENPELKLAPPITCIGCGEPIPYSIYTNPLGYYCFHCKYYYTWIEDSPEHRDKNGNISGGEARWHVGLVKDCADLYTLTRKLLYGGTDWQPHKEQPDCKGDPSAPGICLVNSSGTPIVMSTEELIKTEELDTLRNLGNSAEHAVDIMRELQEMVASSVAIEAVQKFQVRTPTPEEAPELYEKFAQSRIRKEERHEKKAQERFEKRQARRLGTFTPSASFPASLSGVSEGSNLEEDSSA